MVVIPEGHLRFTYKCPFLSGNTNAKLLQMPTILPKLRRGLAKADEFIQEHELAERFEPVATVGGFLIVLSLVLLGIYAVIAIPHVVIQRSLDAALSADRAKQLELEDMYRKTITQIVLGVFGLFLLYFTWRRSVAGDKTVRIAEQGHITDRFTKAIEQLGKTDGTAPNIEVRLGAIYALERIAIDSPRDHWTIMEILTAYVRQNAPLDSDRPYTQGEKPRTDIQAILTVLGRRRIGPKHAHNGQHLDLSESRLCCASLDDSNLDHADFWGANLQGASLVGANLQEAYFYKANLKETNFNKASLLETNLSEANLERAFFGKANLLKASLRGANLQQASFWKANLQETNIRKANLQKTNFNEADLQMADLKRSNLQDATLKGANLKDANLGEAFLGGANLSEANLQEADLGEADLQNADLTDAHVETAIGISVSQIQSARHWQKAHYSYAFRAELGLPPESDDTST